MIWDLIGLLGWFFCLMTFESKVMKFISGSFVVFHTVMIAQQIAGRM